ncbi:MAG: hypothetical protein IPI58_01385 [Alphaproteobacteria bacterium]|nr:MAG: hypothetical protein IPI58_01385 [Alphaproteobacteria bacterium]
MQNQASLCDAAPPPPGLADVIEAHMRAYMKAHDSLQPCAGLYGRVMCEVERPLLRVVLDSCAGNQKRAAAMLGINRNTLHRRLIELGLIEATETAPVRKPSRRAGATRGGSR